MRALVLITLLSFGICFGQENPWALKGENPWKAYPQQATEMPQETDSTSAAKEEKDSISLQARPMEENLSETEIYFRAENRAKEVYKSGGDFAFGFVTGICFNVLGVFPDVIYIAPNFKKEKRAIETARVAVSKNEDDKLNPYTTVDIALIITTTVLGLLYAFNDPLSKIGNINLFPFKVGSLDGSIAMILVALGLFLFLVISRLMRYTTVIRHRMIAVIIFAFFTIFFWMSFEQGASSLVIFARDSVDRSLEGASLTVFNVVNTLLTIVPLLIISWVLILLAKQTYKKALGSNIVLAITFLGIWAIALWMLNNEFSKTASEIDPSWFSILNSFFIIAFASTVSKLWDSKFNPPAAVKYGLGLIIMAIGFGLLAYGAYGISEGVKVSMVWLVLAYLFHTLGELFLSPVGLSYVSKLVPARMIAFMFGMWYLAIAIGNKLAAVLGGQIENITNTYSLSTFFLIFTIVPTVAGLLVIALNPILKKLMHGVR